MMSNNFVCALVFVFCMIYDTRAIGLECTGETVLKFDDIHLIYPKLGASQPLTEYKGLQWDNLSVGNANQQRLDASLIPFKTGQSQQAPGHTVRGYDNGIISRPNIVYNPRGEPAAITTGSDPFNLCSLYATAAYYNNLQVTFTPFVGDNAGDPMVVYLSAEAPQLVPLNFVGVTKVEIDSQTGNPYPEFNVCAASQQAYPDWAYAYDWNPPRCGCHVVLDNMAVDLP